jgi:hypothetical protein
MSDEMLATGQTVATLATTTAIAQTTKNTYLLIGNDSPQMDGDVEKSRADATIPSELDQSAVDESRTENRVVENAANKTWRDAKNKTATSVA